MGIERYIIEELAGISMTVTEMAAIKVIINGQIKNPAFSEQFNNMVAELAKSYDVVIANLQPLFGLESEASFMADFDDRYSAYKACYLLEISKPRAYADEAYEHYLVLKTLRESKTRYPLLQRTFARLDELVDKWVTNDAWLAMGIDSLFKRLHNLLNEIAEIKQKDPEDAYLIYCSAVNAFVGYLDLIRQKRDLLGAEEQAGSRAA